MKNIYPFFTELRNNSGAIWLENGKIQLSAPKKFQNQETKDFIINNKSQIISILNENRIFSIDKFLGLIIFRDNTTTYYPLSSAQERLWFIEQYEQGTNAYHIPNVLELDDNIDIEGIKYALQKIVSRHEILRSTIEYEDNQKHGIQKVHETPLPIEDIRLTDKEDYESLIKKDINRSFDLCSEYPVRVKFYYIQTDEGTSENLPVKTILLINIHHIASDNWSFDIFQRELFAYYKAYVNKDRDFSLPALEIQYKDYALWQRVYLTGEILENQLTFWKEKLSGYQTLELPTDYTRPNLINYEGGTLNFEFSKEVSLKLKALAKDKGNTLYTVLLSSFYILLHKYSGQKDIVIGTPIANRHYRQIDNLIGFFANTLVIRDTIDPSYTFDDILNNLNRNIIDCQKYQDLPFENIVDELNVERNLSRHPIFQVSFRCQNSMNKLDPDISKYFKQHSINSTYTSKFDLDLLIDDSNDNLTGIIAYATSLFEKGTVERLSKYFKRILEQIAENQSKRIKDYNLLSKKEYNQIVYQWNDTDKDYPKDKTIYQLFQEQAERTPGSIAIVYEGQSLTYWQLNEKSNQLARHIRAQHKARANQKLRADTLIALYLDRSMEMIVGILAVLKAGGAYVPIDPSYPQERVDFILEDTKAELILSQKHLSQEGSVVLPSDKTININLNSDIYRKEKTSNLQGYSQPADLAYVIYTSGTTGKPKGVAIDHKAILSLVFNGYIQILPADVFAFLSSPTFDAATFEIWTPLLHGNTLVIPNDVVNLASNVTEFEKFLTSKRITILWLTKTLFENLYYFNNSLFQNLNYLIIGGEALDKNVLNQIISSNAKPKYFLNGYGPTESTTFTCTYRLDKPIEGINVPIGSPVNNRKVYILDQNQYPIPIGVIGELYIGGAGLARGYLKCPELTTERFIPNPFATETDRGNGYDRLYRTGDLVRWLPDGNIEFIGRNDDQVKIRGYRIELGEIEQAMLQIPGIRQSCVLAKERKTEAGVTKCIVGYYVPDKTAQDLSQPDILEKLARVLPEYMIPASLIEMEAFPLTINGKLDKKALPEPDLTPSSENYTAPRTDTETQISTIWSEVLGLEKVSVTDDFFRIGGDSILSIQVSSRIRQLGLNCQVKDIFEHKTISRLAEQLVKKSSSALTQTEQGTLTGRLGLLPVQQWFFANVECGRLVKPNHFNQSFLVRVPALSIEQLEAALEKLVAHHDILRVRFIRDEKENAPKQAWYQVYLERIGTPSIKTLDVARHTELEISEILTIWQSGFDLERGLLFQVGYLYGYKDGSARIYFALHHLIVDAVSWRILTEDMKALYEGRTLPGKGSSYRQWVKSVKQYPSEHPLEQAYWEGLLGQLPPWSKPVQVEAASTTELVELNTRLTDLLLHRISGTYHTQINDLLLTALAYSLKAINQSDVQGITLEGHGREDIDATLDISRTAGWFTVMHPVRLELQASLGESIQHIKEGLRSIPSKGIGFGAFASQAESGVTLNDLPPISFNYLGQFDSPEGTWQITPEGSGESVGCANTDHNLVNINGGVSGGKLMFRIASRLGQATTHLLSASFKAALVEVIEYCKEQLEKIGGSHTPSDFTHARLSQRLIDRMEQGAREHRREVQRIYPATSLQQGFIYHALSQGEDDAYRVQLLYDYPQKLDVSRYLEAWEVCIKQYPILRTAFSWDEGILQVIYDEGQLRYQLHDISHLASQPERDAAIDSIQVEDRKQPFDLTQPTLLRLHIIRQREDYYTILKSEHHSISDGWSLPILLTSLHGYYGQLLEGKKITAQEDRAYLLAQEYIAQEKERVQGYWGKSLASVDGANDIGPLLSRPIDLGGYRHVENPGTSTMRIGGAVYKRLKDFCSREGITINVVVQFVWHKLIQAYSNSSQSIVGTTVSGRDLPVEGITGSVGLYINTLPLLVDWDNENSIRRQLQSIQQKLADLNTHSFADLARMQRRGERLFHSLLVFENYPIPKGDKFASQISIRKVIEKVDYPLGILAYEQEEGLTIRLEYDQAYLTEEKAGKHISALEHILEQVVTVPERPHKKIGLLSAAEYEQIVYQWNATDKDYPKDKTTHQLFQEQAERTPDSIAIVYEGQSLTYRQLNERSNQLARHIRAQHEARENQKLKADTLIALYLDRSLEMIIGILAALKAGGAYVPIDPSYPQERLDFILEDTGTELILAQKHLSQTKETLLPAHKVLHVDLSSDIYTDGDTSNLPSFSKPTDLAYIIYTSGTTGKPKGVMIEHGGVVNLIIDLKGKYNLSSEERFILLANYIFDASVEQMYVPLFSGGVLFIPDNDTILEKSKIEKFITQNRITHIDSTPSYLNSIDPSNLSSLRRVVFGAEYLSKQLFDRYKVNVPTVINEYGPTEATVSSLISINSYLLSKATIQNTRAYILNSINNPVPIGVIGELYIGGVGVARGYLKRPELTAERFVPNPFATATDKANGYDRLYRTGDLARWLPDGCMEFIGRNDDQVKIRGYRIELGEIEQALLQVPSIKQACVMTKERKTEVGVTKYLVGYYVADRTAQELSQPDIIEKLTRVLPDYMVPASLIEMDTFPVTITGKLDKHALPEVEFTLQADHYVAPSTEIESLICTIWQEVLGVERVGVTDNFFEMGGHSLTAMNAVSRIHKELNVEVPLKVLFAKQTIRDLTIALAGMQPGGYAPIGKAVPKAHYPLSSAQKRMYILNRIEENRKSYNMPAILEVEGSLDTSKLELVFRQLIQRHESLRTSFELAGDEIVQIISPSPELSVEVGLAQNHEVDALYERFVRPFDLSTAPLLRVAILSVGPQRHFLMIDMHHIIADGTSVEIIIREIAALYQGLPLPEMPVQYKDYSEWQQSATVRERARKQEEYWRGTLAGTLPRVNLPTDGRRPPVFTFEGAHYPFSLGPELAGRITRLGKDSGTTLSIHLIAILNILIHKYTLMEDIVIGCGIAGRPHAELQQIVGMFVNSIVMRNFPSAEESYLDFVGKVKHSTLEAYENQEYQFEELVEKLNPPRDMSRNPIFDIALVVQNFEMSPISLPGVKISPYRSVNRTAKYDLTLFAWEASGDIQFQLEYYTRIFGVKTVERLAEQLKLITQQVTSDPSIKISEIDIFTSNDRQLLLHEFNSTMEEYPTGKTVIDLFAEQVSLSPENVAVAHDGLKISYRDIDKRASSIASYLALGKGVQPGSTVGILMDRGIDCIAAIIGVLKARAAYVPIDPELPEDRVRWMVQDADIAIIISSKRYLKLLNRLLWGCKDLSGYICTDTSNIAAEEEQASGLMEKELWEYIGQNAADDIEGGGWKSSYTGNHLSREEMDEYGENISRKLQPYIHKNSRILEIGCASGISMFRLAKHVGLYYGTDLSAPIIEKNRERITQEGIANIQLACLSAHEIDRIDQQGFDIVIINSVIQAFPGHNYLRKVIDKAIALMNDHGILFIGDIMDQDLKGDLIADLTNFKELNPSTEYIVKTEFAEELFVSRGYFKDLEKETSAIADVAFSTKIHTIENELTRFRYDALISVDKKGGKISNFSGKLKAQDDARALECCADLAYSSTVKPSDLAYVIYTSGTTGKPKGVMVEHGGLVNMVSYHKRIFSDGPHSRMSQVASISFDAMVNEVFPCLTCGGQLYIATNETRIDPLRMRGWIIQHAITNSFQSTALGELLMHLPWPDKGVALEALCVAGDKLKVAPPKDLPYKVFNLYGPTEDTVWTTIYEVMAGLDADNIPIGHPIANKQIYILSHDHHLAPIGVPGEICIAGAGLARGYLKRPELTTEKFVDNPFTPGTRMYRTGDLARWKPDGNIEFLGRMDDQVKIRGFRIELGEVEQAMLQIPGIKQSCVLDKERKTEAGTTKYLVGYYVLEAPLAISPSEIADKLTRILPDYMIPASLIEMEVFPRTINGKLDKRALPEAEFTLQREDYVVPSTEIESQLCAIWQKVLGLERVGVTDDFFHIGGNSILAIQVSHRMSKSLGCEIRVADIFKHKTIVQLLAHNVWQVQVVIPRTASLESPLSFAQERLWFIEQYEQGSNAYHMPVVLEFASHTDVQGVKYALQQIVARHEVLRSTIEQEKNQKHRVQLVHDDALVIEDITLDANTDYLSLLHSEVNRPFNLSSEYPIRVKFYRIEPAAQGEGATHRKLLLINTHHIASDGWSMEILQKELLAYYQAYIQDDKAFSLPALEIQYKDFAAWQRGFVTGEVLERQISYWRGKLSGYQTLETPTDFVRPVEIDYKGASEVFSIEKELSDKLRALSQANGTTMHSLMLSSIAILLGKYTGQDDIVIGSPIANRHYRQTEGLIGFFVNTQVNRIQLGEKQSYNSLAQGVQQDQIASQGHQDLPFERLVEELKIPRDPSRHPIFQVMFGVQSFGSSGKEKNQLEAYFKPLESSGLYEVEKFDLSIFIDDSQDELRGQISYATSLFERQTIKRIISHYQHLLSQLCRMPEQPYSQFSLLSAEEYDQIVYGWNATDREYPKDKTIHCLFEEQAERTPDSIAIVYEGQSLTYRQLNEKSNQLARHIRAQYEARTNQELKADTLIALYLERGLEMVIGILAVLKAGGAYAPIDTSYPQERVDYLLEDSGAELILSQQYVGQTRGSILPTHRVLNIDLSNDFYTFEDKSNLPSHSAPTDLAYVIYTSGTTGKPKGVMVEHRGINNLVQNQIKGFGVETGDKAILFASYVFDATISEIFTVLTRGASLHIIPDSTKHDTNLIGDFIQGQGIKIATLPPVLLSSMLPKTLSELKTLVVAGETCPAEVMEVWSEGRRLINAYGPTEGTVCTTMHRYSSGDINTNIGKPLGNIRVYVLDASRTPVPVGVIGELYIGGAGLARGYLKRSELTTERFVPNPFATEADRASGYDRLYRTGDLARWLPDGNIEFIGRNDDQVKIRGYRIELGEVEHALLQIPGIKQCCVLAKERKVDAGTTKYLVGYYVVEREANEPEGIPITELRSALSENLPEYMIPSYFVPLSRLPLNVNGKIDRKALPKADENIMSGTVYEAPRNKVEEKLCRIWQDVLGIERVGIHDSFFELGGHSILAMNAVSLIKNRLNAEVPLSLLFRKPQISDLSAYITSTELYLGEMLQGDTVYSLNKEGKKAIFAFPPIIGYGIVFKHLSYFVDNFSLYAFDFIEDENRLLMYVDIILSTQKEGPYILMGYSSGGNLAYEVAVELVARGYQVSDIIMVDALRSYETYNNLDNEYNDQNVTKMMETFMNGYQDYAENPINLDFIIRRAVQKTKKYAEYMSRMINDRTITAKIHLILSEENKDENRMADWELVSGNMVVKYQGRGLHIEMLSDPENLMKNAAIINEILGSLTLKYNEIEYQQEEEQC